MSEKMLWAAINHKLVNKRLLSGSGIPVKDVNVLRRINTGICFGRKAHVCYELYEGKETGTLWVGWLDIYEFTEPPTPEERETMKMLGYTWGDNE